MTIRRTFLLVAILVGGGCGGNGPSQGSGLVEPATVMVRVTRPEPIGEKDGILVLYLKNQSGTAVTVTGIETEGDNLGSVVEVESNRFAPFGDWEHMTPAGIFRVSPPAIANSRGTCDVQTLLPLGDGFAMQPGAEARVFTVTKTVGVGHAVLRPTT